MDEFPLISDHGMLLQGHSMFGAEGCLGIRSSSGVMSAEGNTVPKQDHRKNKGKDMFYSDWPELAGFDDLEPSLSYFDDIDFSIDRSESTVLKTNPTNTKQQSRNGASDTPLNCDAHAASSCSGLSDAELFFPVDDIELANQIGGCEGLEAMLGSSQEMQVPTASSSMCSDETVASYAFSGPDFLAAHIPRLWKKPHVPFTGAPDMILEGMAENPLDMYFPPLATYEQPEMLVSDTTSAQKRRFPDEFAGSSALNCAESQFCSKEMASAALHGQPSSARVLQAVPVKDLGFQRLQEGMNQLDLATRGRIRDALYRLANTVEQRHCVATSASGGVGSSGSKRFKLGGGGWNETQTSPMDQSVAKLLLQKPSYRKTIPPHRVT
ncbi:hypothetical protein BAE44_0016289 [Dichanthelium oligosanthes]|uniref:Protein LNK1 n=1 Tax=Dichanthelium oligosanthes TaxID=888268 RepID=A0A1E5VC16_9POAL|nr:hypothetical protein BAE44_0016289 [Dichanthelium oligosanthes]